MSYPARCQSADVVLGDTMSVSREHAIIRYNFDQSVWTHVYFRG